MGQEHHADNAISPNAQDFRAWLGILFPTVLEIKDDKSLWHFRAQDGAGRYPIDVARPLNNSALLAVQTNIVVIGPVQRQLAQLSPIERKHFICDLRLCILSFDIAFQGIADPLDTLMLIRSLFVDTVTRDSFLQAVTTVDRARHAVLTVLERFNEDAPSPETSIGSLVS